ncbi:uncharacterized protein LOC143280455 [Babylonia areolata]|uniref:uncharacterized protein LOC143280455 n=1 Tax=Babylonia areolata TaxID=304850 RepID=UPI003FCF350B
MKLNNQILRSRSVGPLKTVEYLDLSELGLVTLGRFTSCPKVVSLILRGNQLQDASGLEACRQLWHVDLSNNQLCCLEGLSRFLSLGTLVLSNNQLTWDSLAHLRHIHILALSLHGNPQLDKDPFYRIHVIDCLPNVWMLDGRIVTSAERIQVKQFFHDSALTDKPVRRKLKKDSFVPSTLKKLEIDGIFGKKAEQLMTTFPKNAVLNVETDWKRLQYLAQILQEDISLEWQYTARKPGGLDISHISTFLTDLFAARFTDRERCNMVLLMLVASLDFVLPTHLVRDTLDTGKLLTIGSVQTMDLFLLPRLLRCKVVSLLVSAVKVDREESEDGGLYTKLYLCLYHMVSQLTRLSETSSSSSHSTTPPLSRLASQLEDYKCLLATEVVQLMCIVPSFFDYLDRDIGVMNLVRIATADPDINEKLIQISKTKEEDESSQNAIFKEMADFLLMKVQEQLQNLTNKPTIMSTCDRILSKSDALPMKGEHSPLCKAEYLVRGMNSPDDEPPAVNPRKMSAKTRAKFPHLGDRLLLGPQTIGKIISLPQPTMALVIIDAVPVASGAVERKLKEADQHYTYVNMDQLEWDSNHSMWKPTGTIGDKFTLQAVEDFNREALTDRMADDSFRPVSPELGPGSEPQAVRASTPLIFTNTGTPRQQIFVPTDYSDPKPKQTRRPQRPLSSVYKERLKLSLDLSRRAQSAGSRRPFAVTYGSKPPTSKSPKVANLQLDLGPGTKVDRRDREGGARGPTTHSSRRGYSEGSPSSDPSPPLLLLGPAVNTDRTAEMDGGGLESMRSSQPAAQSTPKGKTRDGTGKENEPPAADDAVGTSAPRSAPYDGEPPRAEETSPERHSSAPDKDQKMESPDDRLPARGGMTTRSDSILWLKDRTDGLPQTRQDQPTNVMLLTSASESPRMFGKTSTSASQQGGRSRPKSAVERQRAAGSGQDSIFHTEFQQQRIDAWKQTTRPAAQPIAATIPPQPPSSPTPQAAEELSSSSSPPPPPPPPHVLEAPTLRTRSPSPCPEVLSIGGLPHGERQDISEIMQRHMPRANLWLAGGRDLFWEGLKGRPKSGHTPGWKEGLPDSMNQPRPKSAAARLHRRTKTLALYSSSAPKERSVLHGTMLNDHADFRESNQFQNFAGGAGRGRFTSRRYSCQRSLYDEDPLPGPVPDNVYSPIQVVSYQRPAPSYLGAPPYLPCLYEDYLHDLDWESHYTPACNTPTPH